MKNIAKPLKILLASVLAAVLLAPSASAETSGITLGAGIGLQSSPYKQVNTRFSPIPLLGYENEYVYLRGITGGYKFYTTESLELSVFARYDAQSFDSKHTENGSMRQLRNRRESASGGLAVRYTTPMGMLFGNVAVDLLNRSRSLTGEVGIAQSWEFGPLEIIPVVGAHFYNRNYNTYYYGVSDAESRRSGYREYLPGGGMEPYAGLTFDYSFTDAFEAIAGAECTLLSPNARHSPMVSRNAILNLNFGLMYSF